MAPRLTEILLEVGFLVPCWLGLLWERKTGDGGASRGSIDMKISG